MNSDPNPALNPAPPPPPIVPSKPNLPAANLPHPGSAAKLPKVDLSDRFRHGQPNRNYDPGIASRAAREHGRGRHGG